MKRPVRVVRQRTLIVLLCLLMTACSTGTLPTTGLYTPKSSQVYRQPAPITSQYFPDPDVRFLTPAFGVRGRFTNQLELLEYIRQISTRTPYLHIRSLAVSPQGRDIPMLVFTDAKDGSPQAIRKQGKPTVWIHAQQHGNEPAAGEGALALASELANSLSWVLKRINVVIVPRVNPDGASFVRRHTASQFDPNRDSMRMLLIESRALRQANLAYAPIVTVDAHEYNPVRKNLRQYGEAGYLEAHDMMILGALNPNIPAELRELTDNLLVASAMKEVSLLGYSVHRYYIARRPLSDEKLRVRSGGTAARIGRNYHGLINQASVLLESRGISLGRTSFRRRVHTQLTAMRAIVKTSYEHVHQIVTLIARVKAQIVAKGKRSDDDDLLVVRSQPTSRQHVLPYIDLAQQKRKLVAVQYLDYANQRVDLVRRRPTAYIMRPEFQTAARTLRDIGLRVELLKDARLLEVEAYQVLESRRNPRLYEGAIRRNISTSVNRRIVRVPAGSFIVNMDQPLANLAALALEPEGGDSFFCFGLLPSRKGSLLPVYRYLSDSRL